MDVYLYSIFHIFRKLQPDVLKSETAVYCPLLNISSCPVTETTDTFLVTTYNPLAKPRSHLVRVPVPAGSAYNVTDPSGLYDHEFLK